MKDTPSLKIRVLGLILVSIILTLISVSALLFIRDNKMYPSNLVVNGTSLASLQKSQVAEFLHDTYSNEKLVLAMPKGLITLDVSECGITINSNATLEKIEEIGSFPIYNLIHRGSIKEVKPVFEWDEAMLIEALDKLAKENSKPATNAQVIYKNYDFIQSIPHENGYQINKDELLKIVEKSLNEGNLGPITVPLEEILPQVTLNDLQKMQGLIAITNYKNIRLNKTDEDIISVLDNTIILAGDTLSLDDLWSKHDIDIKGSTITRVLNSLLNNINSQINLDYDKTTNTINNNLKNPILLNVYLDKDILWLSVIGNHDDTQKKISLISEEINIPAPTTKRIDTSLSAGEQNIVQGKDTLIIKKYRVIEQNGEIIEKVLLAEEKYLGFDTIIYYGPGTINK